MAGRSRRNTKYTNVLCIIACVFLAVGLILLLGWNRQMESEKLEKLKQVSKSVTVKEMEEREEEEQAVKSKKEEAQNPSASEEDAVASEDNESTVMPSAETAVGISCWGDDLINGEPSATYSYMAVLQKLLQENGYDLPVVNKTLQGGGTLSMLTMAGVSDEIIQSYVNAHKQAANGSQPYIMEVGIRDLTEEQKDRSDNDHIPVIFMGYYGGWNHNPAELAEQQEHILNTFKDKEKFLVVGTRPVDETVDSATLDSVLGEKWKEHYISLASVTDYPASTYEAQEAMAQAVYQKLVELNYISK